MDDHYSQSGVVLRFSNYPHHFVGISSDDLRNYLNSTTEFVCASDDDSQMRNGDRKDQHLVSNACADVVPGSYPKKEVQDKEL